MNFNQSKYDYDNSWMRDKKGVDLDVKQINSSFLSPIVD